MKHYCSSDFLIIDDFGLKPLTDQQPMICMTLSTNAIKRGR